MVDISALGGAVAGLSSLQRLEFDFADCFQFCDVSALSGSVAALSLLQHLQIDFVWSSHLVAVFGTLWINSSNQLTAAPSS